MKDPVEKVLQDAIDTIQLNNNMLLNIIELLKDMEDSNPCVFDHHGNCQEHGWTGDRECPQSRLKKFLGKQ
jgi:hypothetical protein